MPGWLWGIVIVYVIGRSAGKIGGAYLGAKFTNSPKTVRNYLGIGLFAQGGVAVGLSLMASQRLGVIKIDQNLMLSDVIIFGITATTLIVQILGPPLVKLAVSLAGETGKNITEEDIIETMKVKDVMDKDVVTIPENQSVRKVLKVFANNEYMVYPVVDGERKILGTVSLEGVKSVLDDQQSWNWLVASDIMEPSENSTMPSFSLKDTINRMRDMKLDQIAIVSENDSQSPAGMLDLNRARKKISRELLRRQEAA
jgi:predicted transcriptional regulator